MVKTYAKKITAILTAVTIIFSMLLYFPDGTFSDISFGLKASAAEITPTEPSTDDNGVYQIGTAAQLYWFAGLVCGTLEGVTQDRAANAVLTADITVNKDVLNANGELNESTFKEWTTIGNYSYPYRGAFDGQGHTVSGLYFNDSSASYVGLFAVVATSASVSNVGVVDSYFNGNENVGGVSGYNNGKITNCYNTATVSGSKYVGGVSGYNGPGGKISNCYNVGIVKGTSNTGCVVGYNAEGVVSNCYYSGEKSDDDIYVPIKPIEPISPSVPAITIPTLTVSTNTETNTSTQSSSDTTVEATEDGNATCKTAEQFASGEVAYLLSQGCTINEITYDGSIWGQKIGTDPYPVLGGAKVYKIKNTYCDNTTGIGYVYSNSSSSYFLHKEYGSNGFCTNCGAYEPAIYNKTANHYEISNAGQLYWFAGLVNGTLEGVTQDTAANAVLTADITVNTGVLKSDGTLADDASGFTSWTPIGNSSKRYAGTFDGQGHTVSGLYFNDEHTDYVGLFGYINSTVQNVGVIDSYFRGSINVGGVCGYSNVGTITSCYNTGTVNGTTYVGGVCGYNNFEGTITSCYNTGTVTGTARVGGVCGDNNFEGTIISCYNKGTVSGRDEVGGVCGYSHGGTITNCYNTGTVSGSRYVGGVCGYNDGHTITGCYNTGTVKGDANYVGGVCGTNAGTITSCYNTGAVSGKSNVGGVCGCNNFGAITNCYFDSNKYSGNAVGTNEGTVTDVEGKTTAQFNSGEVAYLLSQGCTIGEITYDGSIWGQDLSTANTYPVLDSTKKVYCGYVGTCKQTYSNEELSETPVHSYDENGFCTNCGAYEPAEIISDETSQYNGYYTVENAGQLYWFAGLVNGTLEGVKQNTAANAVLTADITVNTGVLKSDGTLADDTSGFTSWTPIGHDLSHYTGTFDGQNHTISGLYFNSTGARRVGLFGCSQGTVKNVGVVDSYFKENWYVGGVCGYNYGTITGCYNAGTVSGLLNSVGGVCGMNSGTITDCCNTGTVSVEVSNTGAGTANIYVGGVCGWNKTGSEITGCYNIGEVRGTGTGTVNIYDGGVCGYNGGTIINCYYDSDKYIGNAVEYNEGTVTDVDGKTTDQFASGEVAYLLNGSTSEGTLAWGQKIGTDLSPVFGGVRVYYETESSFYSNYEPATYNTTDSRYEISSAGQLYWFADYVNCGNTSINAVLTAPITVNTGDVANCNGTRGDGWIDWTPIGKSTSTSYTGTFNGQGYTVSGLYFNDSNTSYVGLFGSVESGGKVSGVGIADSYFRGNDYVGSICGENGGIITNCYNSGVVIAVNRKASAGGICGYNEGAITNCYNTGNISAEGSASLIGGVCADNDGTITNCYYLAETADENGGKTTAQFNSGEVAYLLSQGCTIGETTYDGSIWGQEIGTDPYPVLNGKKVLANVDLSDFANDIIVYGQSASLDGTIGFNIYVSADDSYEWDKTVNDVQGVEIENGLYKFTYQVAAKDMDKKINFTVNDKIDVTVSVSDYLAVLSKSDNESLKNLADSMSVYGDAAKAYFSGEAVAEQTVTDDLSVYDFTLGTMPEGISYYGSSLILKSETTIRHYFKLAEGKEISDYTFSVDGMTVTPTEKQGYYCIDIKNVRAEKLGTSFNVSVNGEEVITNYSALSYVYKVMESDSTDYNLKNLVKALYIYNRNALAYITA